MWWYRSTSFFLYISHEYLFKTFLLVDRRYDMRLWKHLPEIERLVLPVPLSPYCLLHYLQYC
jgi:hypothetical protein